MPIIKVLAAAATAYYIDISIYSLRYNLGIYLPGILPFRFSTWSSVDTTISKFLTGGKITAKPTDEYLGAG